MPRGRAKWERVLLIRKVCKRCGLDKSALAFPRQTSSVDGLQPYCRACGKEKHAQWRMENDRTDYYRSYEGRRPERPAPSPEQRAKAAITSKRWAQAHPEKFREYVSHRKGLKKHGMDDADRELSRAYRAAIANDLCFYCGQRTANMHDDHYYPLSKRGGNHWWRLVRACGSCNDTKNVHCGTWFRLRRAGWAQPSRSM